MPASIKFQMALSTLHIELWNIQGAETIIEVGAQRYMEVIQMAMENDHNKLVAYLSETQDDLMNALVLGTEFANLACVAIYNGVMPSLVDTANCLLEAANELVELLSEEVKLLGSNLQMHLG